MCAVAGRSAAHSTAPFVARCQNVDAHPGWHGVRRLAGWPSTVLGKVQAKLHAVRGSATHIPL